VCRVLPVRRGDWVARVRADPKGALEADLVIAVAGVVIIVMGGLVAVAGVHNRGSTDNAGNPVLGNIIAVAGLVAIALGVLLAVANVVIWLTGRRRGDHPTDSDGHFVHPWWFFLMPRSNSDGKDS
jgi:hypothetical protein